MNNKTDRSTNNDVIIETFCFFLLFGPFQTSDDVMNKNVWQGRKFFRKFRLMLVIVGKLKDKKEFV